MMERRVQSGGERPTVISDQVVYVFAVGATRWAIVWLVHGPPHGLRA